MARDVRLLGPVRLMKERHIRLELAQASSQSSEAFSMVGTTRAVGWDMAFRATELRLAQGSRIDLAYRIRENDHPEYGGLEVEIAGMEPTAS